MSTNKLTRFKGLPIAFIHSELFHVPVRDKVEYVENLLGEEDRIRVDQHLDACESCRNEIARLRTVSLSPEQTERIVARFSPPRQSPVPTAQTSGTHESDSGPRSTESTEPHARIGATVYPLCLTATPGLYEIAGLSFHEFYTVWQHATEGRSPRILAVEALDQPLELPLGDVDAPTIGSDGGALSLPLAARSPEADDPNEHRPESQWIRCFDCHWCRVELRLTSEGAVLLRVVRC